MLNGLSDEEFIEFLNGTSELLWKFRMTADKLVHPLNLSQNN